MWFHSLCVGVVEEIDADKAKDRGQKHILVSDYDDSLWARVISQPIQRVSREHKAPLSLEKLQAHLIRRWHSGRVLKDESLAEDVRQCGLFDGEIPSDFMELVEDALALMGEPRWMTCRICHSYYI